jgi:putative toxin-antitoxin system antitoxin component (TIGR02293 family)
MTYQVINVETFLGLKTTPQSSRVALANLVKQGLPVKTVRKVAKIVAPTDGTFKYQLVAKATLERREREKQRLSPEESDRLARLGKVFVMGMKVYNDEDKVREFLRRPHMMLGGKPPLEVALANGAGADVVVNILGRIAYGAAV